MMASGTWLPAENFVRNGVKLNYTVAVKVSSFHFNALTAASADPAIAALLVLFTPFHEELINSSSTKDGAVGTRKSDTQAKDEMFVMLTKVKLPVWRVMISNVYLPGSVGYRNIFPDGMEPFHKGTIENKLLAVLTLRNKCQADSGLTAVAALIASFYILILGARGNQEGEKTLVGVAIDNQKAAIEAMCIQHFADYGAIVSLAPNEPTKIKSFVDVVTLQNHVHSPIYAGVVNKNKIRKVATKKVTSASTVQVRCDVDIMIWVNDLAKNPIHPVGVLIPANTPTIATFPRLGNPDNRVFQIHNLSLTTKGNYSIEFL